MNEEGIEIVRKIIHIGSALVFFPILIIGGRELFLVFVFFIFVAFLIVLNLREIGIKIAIVENVREMVERKNVKIVGIGVLWFLIGILIASSLLKDVKEIAAILCALILGDGTASVIGKYGKFKIRIKNSEKSVEGALAFFIFSSVSLIFIGERALIFSLFLTLIEFLPLKFDDNFLIPVAGTIFFLIF